jgi:hypothetical protein
MIKKIIKSPLAKQQAGRNDYFNHLIYRHLRGDNSVRN